MLQKNYIRLLILLLKRVKNLSVALVRDLFITPKVATSVLKCIKNIPKAKKAAQGICKLFKKCRATRQAANRVIGKAAERTTKLSYKGFAFYRKGGQGLIGKDFEDFLIKKLGGKGSFIAKSSNASREFDGAIGKVWYEAKSGEYWKMLQSSQKGMAKFISDMGRGLSIAKVHGATYELHSNTPIPQNIKDWLFKKGIKFTEWF